MTDHQTPDGARSSAEAFIEELRAFAASEAEELEALAAELAAIRESLPPPPAFEREAIWARIAGRVRPPSESPD